MTEFNSYPVFVADQVLMAEHLNEIVNYLDEQDRLTRNKLIGIGIVCGLELKVTSSKIEITKGCGVTSAGYLLVLDQLSLTHYRPYTLPSDFIPKYKSIYENWQMWELLTAEQSLAVEDASSVERIMSDKIVLLLLEMKEKPLKNCVDTDCDDKGDKIVFAVKPLLVKRSDIDKYLRNNEGHPTNDEVSKALPDMQLKRFNVPVNQLTSTDVVLNAFLDLVDETTLKRLAEVLNKSYQHYKPILFEEATNPFSDVFEVFKARLAAIKDKYPFFIQYFYDWIDDIHKAYYEFKSKVYKMQTICCPTEDLFPLHLMLGEGNNSLQSRSHYRHHFLYSPLFNNQENLLAEVQSLFKRMKVLIQSFTLPNQDTITNTLVKITPSNYLDKPLSDRCIPYYYKPEELYQCWSWNKAKMGKAAFNLSYNADQYNDSDVVINPLLYDIERFNFFRVEGHIGKSYGKALSTVLTQRNLFNLPFEVVALSTATVARYVANDDKNCLFKDLESLYKVIIAELVCRFGDLAISVANIPYRSRSLEINGDISETMTDERSRRDANLSRLENLADPNINPNFVSLLGLPSLRLPAYKRGDFLRSHWSVKKGTVGEAYQKLVATGHDFVQPASTGELNLNTVYAHLFYFIDSVEHIMGASWPYNLKDFTAAPFTSRFSALTDEVHFINTNANAILKAANSLDLKDIVSRFPRLINTCFDKRLEALRKEYDKRYNEVRALTNFMNYFRKHPGLEHKAGVPKGGTFILVYHETPPPRFTRPGRGLFTSVTDAFRENLSLSRNISHDASLNELLNDASVRDPVLLKNFELALSNFVNICNEMDEDTKEDIHDILIRIPAISLPDKFRIPEYAVIADFYLPYICCSDCPPITYILPKEPENDLSIRITPTEFCNNDEASYEVIVSPAGGSLSASAGVDPGTFEFKPKGIEAGINKLTYTLVDGRSTSIDVKMVKAFTIDFKYEPSEYRDGRINVQFTPINPNNRNEIWDNRNVIWDFGDGATTTEKKPSHTYQFNEESIEFTVKLTVTDLPCLATKEHSIKLKRPEKIEFTIVPREFCFNDQTSYKFTISPAPQNLEDIEYPDELVIDQNAETGEISFIPEKQNLQTTKEYALSYKDIALTIKVVVPNADFIMKLRSEHPEEPSSNIMLHLEAKEQVAEKYHWTLQSEDSPHDFYGVAVDISYEEIGINREKDLQIGLELTHHIAGRNCTGVKWFTITKTIMKNFLDREAFDNNPEL